MLFRCIRSCSAYIHRVADLGRVYTVFFKMTWYLFFLFYFLPRSCYDAFTENMSGETQMLEKRRQFHCAAYNCAIAVISCVFTESKFYQGFLFTEKPDKVRSSKQKLVPKWNFGVERWSTAYTIVMLRN